MTIICLMDRLPPEIFWPLIEKLRLKEISALSRCNRQNYNFFNEVLYSLDAKRPDRWALHWSAIYNVLGTASKSLAAGSPPNQYCDMRLAPRDPQNGHGEFGGPAVTPLDVAIRYNYDDMVALLLSHGCELSTHPASWLYGLNQAIVNGRKDWVPLYDAALKAHATSDRNKMDKFLIKAINHDQCWAFHYILDHVLPSDRSFVQYLVFEAAACAGSLTWVKRLYNMDFLTSFDTEAIEKLWFKVATKSKAEKGTLVFNYLAQKYPWLDEFRYSDEESDIDDVYDSEDDFDYSDWPRDDSRKMDLYHACENRNLAMIKRLLGLGASPRYVKDDAWPLVEAMEAEDYKMAELLLDGGAELVLEEYRKRGEYDLLLQACRCGNVDILELLIGRGAKVGEDGESACLRWAIRGGHLPMIQYWISQGHQVPDDALHSFFNGVHKSQKAWESAPETARFLIEAGAEVDIDIDCHGTPICTFTSSIFWAKHKLAETERDVALEIVKVLVSFGADCRDIFQQNYFKTNIGYTSLEFLQFLLGQPCIVEVKAESWFSMLEVACRASDEAWCSTLIEYMMQHNMWADYPKQRNSLIGKVCHHWHDNTRSAKYRLLSKLVWPGMETEFTWVVRIFDRVLPDAESLRLLLANGLDIHATYFRDATPLHYSCTQGHASMMSILIDAGADVAAKDDRGRTPMDMIKSFPKDRWNEDPRVGVFELLLMHGSPLPSLPITDAEIDALPGFRQVLDKYVSKSDWDKWLANEA